MVNICIKCIFTFEIYGEEMNVKQNRGQMRILMLVALSLLVLSLLNVNWYENTESGFFWDSSAYLSVIQKPMPS
jgi:hypothetical protein